MTAVKPKLVSLLSNWYSGATLFTILLNRHSQIVSNGETMFFNDEDASRYDCSCGKYIDECDFYEATTRHMRRPGVPGWDKRLFVQVPTLSRNPILRSLLGSPRFESVLRHRIISAVPAWGGLRDRFLEAQLQFFANARQLAHASIYLDGTKSIPRAQLFARSGASDMKVLHLLRDGRGFSASCVRHMDSKPSLTEAAKIWMDYISAVDKFAKSFPSVPVLSVRYEDLCRNTVATVDRICGFLEIPSEDLTVGTMDGMHVLGNRMRRNFNGAIVEDTSWKERLDPATQTHLTSLMRKQLERFGYL